MDLTTVAARIDWADAHARRVRDLSADWSSSALVAHTTLDDQRGVQVFQAQVVGEPPLSIALALGDTVHHARAALDNLVGVLRGGATDRSMFRIDTDPATFERDRERRLEGVPDWAMEAIRQMQPFPDNPLRFIGEALAQLNRLAIIDRHRALLLSAALIDMDETHAATSHPGETRFSLRGDGRLLILEYPVDARVTPHTGVQVIVTEDALQWTDDGARFPGYPAADVAASQFLWAVRRAVEALLQAARAAGVDR